MNSTARWWVSVRAMTSPVATFNAANRSVIPLRT